MADNDSSAGATPAAAGATPAQTTPVSPAPAASPAAAAAPATGDADLGEGGQSALRKERQAARDASDRADRAEQELASLKAAGQSDQEKALEQARREARSETSTQFQALIRAARVEAALSAAGVDPQLLDLAVPADEFAKLKVTEEGTVEGLHDAVEALRKARPALFAKPAAAAGTADGGTRGAPTTTKEQVEAWSKDPVAYLQHRDEIFAFLAAGR